MGYAGLPLGLHGAVEVTLIPKQSGDIEGGLVRKVLAFLFGRFGVSKSKFHAWEFKGL